MEQAFDYRLSRKLLQVIAGLTKANAANLDLANKEFLPDQVIQGNIACDQIPPRIARRKLDKVIPSERLDGFSLVLGDHERRREANSARSAAQEQNAALECELDNTVTLRAGVFLGLLVFDDLHADHQPAAANVTNQAVLLWPVGDPLHDVIANVCRVLQQAFVLDYIERRQRCCNTYGIAAKC